MQKKLSAAFALSLTRATPIHKKVDPLLDIILYEDHTQHRSVGEKFHLGGAPVIQMLLPGKVLSTSPSLILRLLDQIWSVSLYLIFQIYFQAILLCDPVQFNIQETWISSQHKKPTFNKYTHICQLHMAPKNHVDFIQLFPTINNTCDSYIFLK